MANNAVKEEAGEIPTLASNLQNVDKYIKIKCKQHNLRCTSAKRIRLIIQPILFFFLS